MASSDIATFLQTWNQNSADARFKQQKFIEKGFDKIVERKSPLFARLKKGANKRNPEVTWYEELGFERKLTGNLSYNVDHYEIVFSGYAWNAALTAAVLAQHIQTDTSSGATMGGTVVMRDSDGAQFRVTALSSLTATVVEWGNTSSGSITVDSAATTYTIIGYVSSDYDTVYEPKTLDRTARKCGTQIFKDYIEIPWTRSEMSMELIKDELMHQLQAVIERCHKDIAMSLINIFPYYSSGYKYGLETQTSAVTGIISWPTIVQAEYANTNVYVNKSEVAIDTDDLNDLVYYNWLDEKADYNSGKWILACHPVTHQYISDEFLDHREFGMKETEIGYQVEHFRSKIGKTFPILADEYVPADKLLLLNTSALEWGWYGKQKIRVSQLAETKENATVKKVTGQFWGVKARKPRQIGMIYGLPTTYS